MLRWGFLLLLLANGILFGWFYQEQEGRRKVADRAEVRVHGIPELDLVSEVPQSALRPREQPKPDPVEPMQSRFCYYFGPFDDAQGLEAWIGDDGPGRLELESRKVGELPPSYRVYITAPQELQSRRRLLAELASVGLEAEWLEQGALKGQLSLGLYQQELSAKALQQALTGQGYAASVNTEANYQYQYYLLLHSDSEVAQQSSWARSLLQKYPRAKSEKNLCQGLATAQGRE